MKLLPILTLLCLTACSRSLEDTIESLEKGGDEGAAAAQELLLAKESAIVPLLSALEEPHEVRVGISLVEILASLMMRVEDKRIPDALYRHLGDDPSTEVRALIAKRLGIYNVVGGISALLNALEDNAGEVRYEALLALGLLESKLSTEQFADLKKHAHRLLDDPHQGTRLEAMIRAEHYVNEWVVEAQQMALRSQLARAESLYHHALAYSPGSKRGNYRSARFYFDNNQRQKGVELLRQHGMLLDVPRLKTAPVIDGVLGEIEWKDAAHIDSLFVLSTRHYAAWGYPSKRT